MGASRLTGVRVVVTRASDQASSLAAALGDRGADVVEVPTIAIVDPADDGAALRSALANLSATNWLVVTSPNGAVRVARALDDPEDLTRAGVKLAAVGPGTATALNEMGLVPDLVPQRFVAEGLLQAFPEPPAGGGRVVLAQAAGARRVLAEGLMAAGWKVEKVDAYRTIHPPVPAEVLNRATTADAITFTSASTVRGWVAAAGADATPPVVASIGPITSIEIRQQGLAVTVEADPHTIDGLVDALTPVIGLSE